MSKQSRGVAKSMLPGACGGQPNVCSRLAGRKIGRAYKHDFAASSRIGSMRAANAIVHKEYRSVSLRAQSGARARGATSPYCKHQSGKHRGHLRDRGVPRHLTGTRLCARRQAAMPKLGGTSTQYILAGRANETCLCRIHVARGLGLWLPAFRKISAC